MKARNGIYLVSLVCVLLGFFVVKAFNSLDTGMEIGEVATLEKIDSLMNEKRSLEKRKQELDQEIADRQAVISSYENSAAEKSYRLQSLQQEIRNARTVAGLLPLEGPGIEIILNDRKRETILSNNPHIIKFYIVHDSDMLNVINELRDAGAEAITVNGTRIMANSRISCGGPTINVGKYERFAPPFKIQAIGDPDRLMANFQEPDSIYHDLIAWGLEFSIKRVDKIQIPRYLGETELTYAKAIKEGE